MAPIDDLAAALDGNQVTDAEGKIAEETTSPEDSETPKETPDKVDATAEKPAGEELPPKEAPKPETPTGEPEMVELASDESGKRYVPESRFKEVYAKMKDFERKAQTTSKAPEPAPKPVYQPMNKADALEVELLKSTLPQFNPESPEYSEDIDQLGFSLYEGSKDTKGNYAMTRIEAGRKALAMAKKITSKVADLKVEARSVKAQQSDQGITNRVLNREGVKLDPEKMTLEQKEEWLKATGNW